MIVPQMRDERPRFVRHHDAQHQALATHAGKQVGIVANELFK